MLKYPGCVSPHLFCSACCKAFSRLQALDARLSMYRALYKTHNALRVPTNWRLQQERLDADKNTMPLNHNLRIDTKKFHWSCWWPNEACNYDVQACTFYFLCSERRMTCVSRVCWMGLGPGCKMDVEWMLCTVMLSGKDTDTSGHWTAT